MTHDYKRNGTTTLFAALNVLDGHVIGQCQQRHTHAEWLKFLRKIDRETPKDKTLHLIANNYATHKHPAVQEWLARHPRFHMHFTPTSASWLNMVERFFRDITTERIRRGVFTNVPELIGAIDEYIAHHNTKPKPFIWTKSARDILQKVIRANSRLSSKQNATLALHALRHWSSLFPPRRDKGRFENLVGRNQVRAFALARCRDPLSMRSTSPVSKSGERIE
jgi:transposase